MHRETFQDSGQKTALAGRKEAPGLFGGPALHHGVSGFQKLHPACLHTVCHRGQRDRIPGAGERPLGQHAPLAVFSQYNEDNNSSGLSTFCLEYVATRLMLIVNPIP